MDVLSFSVLGVRFGGPSKITKTSAERSKVMVWDVENEASEPSQKIDSLDDLPQPFSGFFFENLIQEHQLSLTSKNHRNPMRSLVTISFRIGNTVPALQQTNFAAISWRHASSWDTNYDVIIFQPERGMAAVRCAVALRNGFTRSQGWQIGWIFSLGHWRGCNTYARIKMGDPEWPLRQVWARQRTEFFHCRCSKPTQVGSFTPDDVRLWFHHVRHLDRKWV